MTAGEQRSVAVVGGGLAGLAAGCALADSGFRVILFERRPFLGGRASSYELPASGEVVDNCQHVLLGCCTNLVDFYRRLGVEDKIRWFEELTFIEPGGRRSRIAPAALPAPLHTVPAFLRAASLGLKDKLAIARGMMAFAERLPEDTEENFMAWLRRHGQTARAIERFWKVVLVSALNEDLERMSVHYGAQVFRESFLKSAEAGRMGVPTVPLTELYGAAAAYITSRGGEVRVRAAVDGCMADGAGVQIAADGTTLRCDAAVVAVPFNQAGAVLPPGGEELRRQLASFQSSPITGIHLWFDREVTELEHAVLLERTIQWMFNKSRLIQARAANGIGSYLELVVSSSKSLVNMPRQEILEIALRELAEFFPRAKDARLLKGTVIKEVHATYSVLPQSDRYRPQTVSPWRGIFLAGDWTRTGWPATMEGAVRSGYQAAEAVAASLGAPRGFLVADLPARGLMRLFG